MASWPCHPLDAPCCCGSEQSLSSWPSATGRLPTKLQEVSASPSWTSWPRLATPKWAWSNWRMSTLTGTTWADSKSQPPLGTKPAACWNSERLGTRSYSKKPWNSSPPKWTLGQKWRTRRNAMGNMPWPSARRRALDSPLSSPQLLKPQVLSSCRQRHSQRSRRSHQPRRSPGSEASEPSNCWCWTSAQQWLPSPCSFVSFREVITALLAWRARNSMNGNESNIMGVYCNIVSIYTWSLNTFEVQTWQSAPRQWGRRAQIGSRRCNRGVASWQLAWHPWVGRQLPWRRRPSAWTCHSRGYSATRRLRNLQEKIWQNVKLMKDIRISTRIKGGCWSLQEILQSLKKGRKNNYLQYLAWNSSTPQGVALCLWRSICLNRTSLRSCCALQTAHSFIMTFIEAHDVQKWTAPAAVTNLQRNLFHLQHVEHIVFTARIRCETRCRFGQGSRVSSAPGQFQSAEGLRCRSQSLPNGPGPFRLSVKHSVRFSARCTEPNT